MKEIEYVVSTINNWIEEHEDEFDPDCFDRPVLDWFSFGWCSGDDNTVYLQDGCSAYKLKYSPAELLEMVEKDGVEETINRIARETL